jgi:aminopeptidase N
LEEIIHQPTYAFPDWVAYDVLVYGKGAMLFDAIRQQTGDELFFSFLQSYFETYRFRNAAKKDLIQILNTVTGEDWSDFMKQWLFDHR